jgi:hypothetical protein
MGFCADIFSKTPFYSFMIGIMCKFANETLLPYFPITYYLFSTCTLCYWRGLAPMPRTLLVYDWFHTCSSTLTTSLDYNPSWDQFRLDGFIDCLFTGGSLIYAWAWGLVPPFCYDYFMLLAPRLVATWDSSHAYMLDVVQLLDKYPTQEAF